MMVNDGRNSCRLSGIRLALIAGTDNNIYLRFENQAKTITKSEHDAMREEVREKTLWNRGKRR